MNATAFTLCRKCHRENGKSENASVGKPSEQIETNTASVESFFIGGIDDVPERDQHNPVSPPTDG